MTRHETLTEAWCSVMPMSPHPSELVHVRATVAVRDFQAGDEAMVDPDHPFVARLIRRGFLQRVVSASTASEGVGGGQETDERSEAADGPPTPSEALSLGMS